MKNDYGYETHLEVPIPPGEEILDIRGYRTGDRVLSTDGKIYEATWEGPHYCTRIILKPRKKRFIVARTEIPYDWGEIVNVWLRVSCKTQVGNDFSHPIPFEVIEE